MFSKWRSLQSIEINKLALCQFSKEKLILWWKWKFRTIADVQKLKYLQEIGLQKADQIMTMEVSRILISDQQCIDIVRQSTDS